MKNLAELIEQYLRGILIQQKKVELQRRELARMFRCAPSQINYVLETRFTLERGFMVESKRGGGGYIRISTIQWRTTDNFPQLIEQLIPNSIGESDLENLLIGLVEKELLDPEAAQLSLMLMNREFSDIPAEHADQIRGKFLKALLLVLGRRD